MELDIYIPSIQKAIEYDGEIWHKSSKKIEIDYLIETTGIITATTILFIF